MTAAAVAPRIQAIRAAPRQAEIFTPEALGFRRRPAPPLQRPPAGAAGAAHGAAETLRRRRAARFPDARPRPSATADWTVAPIPADLLDRRVEITGPVDRKMIINALNSGAKVFMADFEDANAPMWDNMIEGQINLNDRWAGTIDFTDPRDRQGLRAQAPSPAALMVRPRGWHLPERHVTGRRRADVGRAVRFRPLLLPQRQGADRRRARARTSICRSWRATSRRGCGTTSSPTPRSELGVPHGTIKATVLIETLPRRVRDGRDPLRAARPHRRPQLRPLGLHLLLHQAARQEPAPS